MSFIRIHLMVGGFLFLKIKDFPFLRNRKSDGKFPVLVEWILDEIWLIDFASMLLMEKTAWQPPKIEVHKI